MRPALILTTFGFAGILLLTGPASARQNEQGGALTFRDGQGQLVEQYRYPIGCYNVPGPGWVIADLDGPAVLIDGRNCLGKQIGEISDPTRVADNQSVLVRPRPEARADV